MVKPTILKENILVGSKSVYTMKWIIPNNKQHDQEYCSNLIKKAVSKTLKNVKFVHYTPTIYHEELGKWMSGQTFSDHNNIRLFNDDSYDELDFSCSILLLKIIPHDPKQHDYIIDRIGSKQALNLSIKGGNDNNNDCLYNAIAKILNGDMKKITRKRFKQKLHLKRDDKIPVSLLQNVEKILKCKIYVRGDIDYNNEETKDKIVRNVYLRLSNDHFSIDYSRMKDLHSLILKRKYKKIVVVYIDSNENGITGYSDEEGLQLYNIKTFRDCKNKPMNAKYAFVRCDGKTPESAYRTYKNECDLLKTKSKGFYDVFSHNGSFVETAKYKFFLKTYNIKTPDSMSLVEQSIIEMSNRGGIAFGRKGKYYNCIQIDQNGAYYHKLSLKSKIPWGKPNFITIDSLDGFVQLGVYHVKINKTGNSLIDNVFTFNYRNLYTNYDILTAKLLNMKMEIIKGGSWNAMVYSDKQTIPSDVVFGDYVKELNQLKNDGCKMAKKLLTCIWGVLCQKIINHATGTDNKPYKVSKNEVCLNVLSKDDTSVACIRPFDQIFKYDHARIGPFLTSHQRYKMVSVIVKIGLDKCIRSHTDSILTTATFEEIEKYVSIGTELGKFKIEKQGNFQVEHVNSVIPF